MERPNIRGIGKGHVETFGDSPRASQFVVDMGTVEGNQQVLRSTLLKMPEGSLLV